MILKPGFRIQIRISSVFAELLDPDPNFEYGSDSTCTVHLGFILKKSSLKTQEKFLFPFFMI